jgi:integrase
MMSKTVTIVPLTTGRIKGFKFDGRSRDIRWCKSKDSPPGFGVRIYASGRKSYVLQYRHKELTARSNFPETIRNKRILKVIGDCTRMGLAEARTRAHEWLDEIDAGFDPEQDRSLEGVTLAQFLPTYLNIKKKEGVAEKSLYDIERRVRNYLIPSYGDRPLTAITRSRFYDLYLGICSGEASISGKPSPVEANRLHAHVSNIFKVAEIKGAILEGTPYPTRLIQKKRETARKRYLSDPELKALYRALNDAPQSHALYVIQLLCHQGMRKAEVLGLKWDDVHLDRVAGRECEPPHLFVGTTKNGDKLFSVLSPQAITILEHLKTQRVTDTRKKYLSGGKVFPVKDIRRQWNAIRDVAGLEAFTLHDLRHCVGTWLGRLGNTELVISRTLNHRIKSVTEQYSLIPNQQKETALTALANWLEETVGPPILKHPIKGGQD